MELINEATGDTEQSNLSRVTIRTKVILLNIANLAWRQTPETESGVVAFTGLSGSG